MIGFCDPRSYMIILFIQYIIQCNKKHIQDFLYLGEKDTAEEIVDQQYFGFRVCVIGCISNSIHNS